MTRFIWVCSICVFANLAGCVGAVNGSEDISHESDTEQGVALTMTSTGVTSEDAALVMAAATGDPDLMAQAIGTSAACHGRVTCSGLVVCGVWSASAACGSRTCVGECGPRCPSHDPTCLRPGLSGLRTEQFRACHDSTGQVCIEWREGTPTSTRCGDPMCTIDLEP
jgi:hypothetical protein